MQYERCVIENLFRIWDQLDNKRIAEADWEFGHPLFLRDESITLLASERNRVWDVARRNHHKLPFYAAIGLGEWDRQSAEEQAFRHALIAANPQDFGLRLIYADWLAEAGQHDMEQVQRYMAEHQEAPTLKAAGLSYGGGTAKGINYEWAWPMEIWSRFNEIANIRPRLGYWNPSLATAENRLWECLKTRGLIL